MTVRSIDPAEPAVLRLLALADAYMGGLYPAESNHLEPVQALQAGHVTFVGAFDGASLLACGAVKIMSDDGTYGEIKRVFVDPAHRGKGVSLQVMEHLEAHLLKKGIPLARLETGIHQPEALGLYRRLGYALRPPFGAYHEDSLSVFLEKRLAG
jgi:putative acetyltransferase